MMEASIRVEHLSKSFDQKKVLTDINLSIESGKSLVVIGGSGSGKSVLLKSIIGLMQPDDGAITVGDTPIEFGNLQQRDAMMQQYGVLFQGGALFDSLLVWENIAFRLMHSKKMPRDEAKEEAIEKLAAVGLRPDVAMLYPSELSGGMQKRVALARAIATRPKIIFFDEPTTGLDPIMTAIINDLILKCSKELGATTFSITHDMASVRHIADRVALLHRGCIVWSGTVDEMEATDNPYVQQFVHGRIDGPIQMEVGAH
jgi:phospholipid/cholesterol/gamma-HCH transport system ATP-binding protein